MSRREAARAAEHRRSRVPGRGPERATTPAGELERLIRRHHEARIRLQIAGRLTDRDRRAHR